MITSLFNNSLCTEKRKDFNKEFLDLTTALNILYLLTQGFVVFNKGSNIVAYINEGNSLQKIKNFLDIENTNGYLLMPFNKDSHTLFMKNDIQLDSDKKIIEYAETLLLKTIQEYEDNHNVCIDNSLLLQNINNIFSENVEEIVNDSDFSSYENAFTACMEFLEEHKKVVLSRYIDLKNGNITKAFVTALSLYPYAHCYLFVNEKKECFMAASPEVLASYQEHNFYTTSLAGSMKAAEFEDIKNVIWSVKNQEEQRIVTDYIVAILKQFNKEINVSLPYTFKAGPVIHIKSDIQINNITLKEALNIATLLNPTPAVCGNPTMEAYKFLLEHEGYNREYYAGVVGYKENDTFSFFVNLRCAKYFDKKTRIYAGGGLIASSLLMSEYEETNIKMKTLKAIL